LFTRCGCDCGALLEQVAVFCTMIGSSDRSDNSEFDRNEPELTGSRVVYWGVMSEDIVGVMFSLE